MNRIGSTLFSIDRNFNFLVEKIDIQTLTSTFISLIMQDVCLAYKLSSNFLKTQRYSSRAPKKENIFLATSDNNWYRASFIHVQSASPLILHTESCALLLIQSAISFRHQKWSSPPPLETADTHTKAIRSRLVWGMTNNHMYVQLTFTPTATHLSYPAHFLIVCAFLLLFRRIFRKPQNQLSTFLYIKQKKLYKQPNTTKALTAGKRINSSSVERAMRPVILLSVFGFCFVLLCCWC